MTGTDQPGPTVEFNVHFKTGNRGSKHLRRGRADTSKSKSEGRTPRVRLGQGAAFGRPRPPRRTFSTGCQAARRPTRNKAMISAAA